MTREGRRRQHGSALVALARHEARRVFREPRTFIATVVLVALAAAVPLLAWPSSRAIGAGVGREVFAAFLAVQLVAALLCVAAVTAGAIAGEREARTWETLRTIPSSAATIAWAKLFGSGAWLAALVIAAAPIASLLVLLGGFSFEDVARAYAATFASIVSGLLVGVSISLRARSTAAAAMRVVVWLVFWNVGLAIIAIYGSGAAGWEAAGSFATLALSPLSSLLPSGMRVDDPATPEWIASGRAYLVFAGVVGAVHLARTLLLAGAAAPPPARSRRARRGAGGAPKMRSRRYLLRSVVALPWIERTPLGHPVFRAALHDEPHATRRYRWSTFATLVGIVLLARGGWSPGGPGLSDRQVPGFTIGLSVVLIALMTPATSAGAIPRERRSRRLEQVFMTGLRPGETFFAVWLAAVHSTWPILAGAASCLIWHRASPYAAAETSVLLQLAVIAQWALVASSISTLCGALLRKPVAATLTALVVTLGVLLLGRAGAPDLGPRGDVALATIGYGARLALDPLLAIPWVTGWPRPAEQILLWLHFGWTWAFTLATYLAARFLFARRVTRESS